MFSHWCLSGTWQTTKYGSISLTLKSGEMQKAVIRGFAQKWHKMCRKSPLGKAHFAPVYSSSARLIYISSSWPFLHSSLCHTCVKTFTSAGDSAGRHFRPGWQWRGGGFFLGAHNSTYLWNCPSFTECTYLSSPSLSSPEFLSATREACFM